MVAVGSGMPGNEVNGPESVGSGPAGPGVATAGIGVAGIEAGGIGAGRLGAACPAAISSERGTKRNPRWRSSPMMVGNAWAVFHPRPLM